MLTIHKFINNQVNTKYHHEVFLCQVYLNIIRIVQKIEHLDKNKIIIGYISYTTKKSFHLFYFSFVNQAGQKSACQTSSKKSKIKSYKSLTFLLHS